MVVQHPGTYVAEIFDAHCLQHIEGQSLVGNGFIGQEVFYYRMVAARTDKYSLYSRRGCSYTFCQRCRRSLGGEGGLIGSTHRILVLLAAVVLGGGNDAL